MPGDLDPAYVAARRALLTALQALEGQLQALVLVGAQAVYMHTGAAEFAVAEYTTDGDIAIDPAALSVDPDLEEAMRRAGFELDLQQPGTWMSAGRIEIDLLVPDSLGGSGRRGARLGPHGKRAARKASGLEAALIDNEVRVIEAFEEDDERLSGKNLNAGPQRRLRSATDSRNHSGRMLTSLRLWPRDPSMRSNWPSTRCILWASLPCPRANASSSQLA
ncbi:MAG: hypothetical protein ACE14W_00045 [Candidatus Velamenicoccus archaeovorus]